MVVRGLRRARARQGVSFLLRPGRAPPAAAAPERRRLGPQHRRRLRGDPRGDGHDGAAGGIMTATASDAPRVITVIQARSGSTRLPGKVLLPLGAATVLGCMLARVRRAEYAGTVMVATTTDPADDDIARQATGAGALVFRGHPTDLLDRHYQAARLLGADLVVKIPSDCPLIDPAVIDRVLAHHVAQPADYTSNLHPQSYPDGNDVEVCTFAVLESAWRYATRPLDREHTTPFLWDPPGRFRVANVVWETGQDLSRSHRVVLDYAEDYEVIRAVYDALFPSNPEFTVRDVVDYLDAHPEIASLNAVYRGVNWYRHHLAELTAVSEADT